MFIKLFTQILDSSIADNRRLRHFFTDLMLCADWRGYVIMTNGAIARRIGCSLDEVEWGLSELEKPDPHSKTPDCQGARIERLEGVGYGWRIINYETYRAMKDADQLRETTKERVRRFRDSKKSAQNVTLGNEDVTPCNASVTHGNAITEAEAEADTKEKKEELSLSIESPIVEKSSKRKTTAKEFIQPELEEMRQFCRELGLPPSDGEYMFYHMEENDWQIKSKPIKDWKATIRKWKAAKYLPSLKEQAQKTKIRSTNEYTPVRSITESSPIRSINESSPIRSIIEPLKPRSIREYTPKRTPATDEYYNENDYSDD